MDKRTDDRFFSGYWDEFGYWVWNDELARKKIKEICNHQPPGTRFIGTVGGVESYGDNWLSTFDKTKETSMDKIVMGKKYQTRDGRAVRILCTDLQKDDEGLTVVGLITQRDGREWLEMWTAYGRRDNRRVTVNDLILVPTLTKHEGWIVVDSSLLYGDRHSAVSGIVWETEDEAKRMCQSYGSRAGFICTVAHITWETED